MKHSGTSIPTPGTSQAIDNSGPTDTDLSGPAPESHAPLRRRLVEAAGILRNVQFMAQKTTGKPLENHGIFCAEIKALFARALAMGWTNSCNSLVKWCEMYHLRPSEPTRPVKGYKYICGNYIKSLIILIRCGRQLIDDHRVSGSKLYIIDHNSRSSWKFESQNEPSLGRFPIRITTNGVAVWPASWFLEND